MSHQPSELVAISGLVAIFGEMLGAFLYLGSISAVHGRSWFRAGLLSAIVSGLLGKNVPSWLRVW